MDKSFHILGFPVSLWVIVPAFYLTWVIVGWAAKRFVFGWLRRLSAKTATQIDDILLGAAEVPVTIMIFVWGVAALMHFLGPDIAGRWPGAVSTASKVATLAAIAVFVDRVALHAIRASAMRFDVMRITQPFATVVVHGVILGLVGLMLLDSFGISITPLVASLGIGSLAVALALQPTLENFFSGFQILLDQPIKPGHFVKLESGEEGYVDRIGWRTTWVRQLSNNMVIIPNKQLVNARLINYYYPSTDQAVLVQVGVHYASDLAKVERVTVEVGEEIMKRVQGAVPDFKPFIRFHTFNASSIDFTVILRAKEFVDNYLIKHEFIKALAARYARENIVIPFPIAAINTSQEAAIFKPS